MMSRLQRDALDASDAIRQADALQRAVGYDVVQREDHQRLTAVRCGPSGSPSWRHRANIHPSDVDSRLAQNRADLAHHAGPVEVVAEEDMPARLEVRRVLIY